MSTSSVKHIDIRTQWVLWLYFVSSVKQFIHLTVKLITVCGLEELYLEILITINVANINSVKQTLTLDTLITMKLQLCPLH